MAQFGEQLCQGNIQARPVAEACKHCDFHDICGRINQDDVTDVKDSVYEEKLMEELTDRKEKNNWLIQNGPKSRKEPLVTVARAL